MKILHVSHAYYPALGGAEFLVRQVSEYLANAAKEDVTVFTTFAYNTCLFTDPKAPSIPGHHEAETIDGVKIRRFPVINRWGRILYFLQYIFYRLRLWGNGRLRVLFYGPISPAMKKAIKDFPADIIIGIPFPLNHMNYVFKNRRKPPVILVGCMHTQDRHGFKNPVITKNIRRADGYIALTPHEKDYLVRKLKIPAEKIKVIGVGLKIDSPEPVDAAQKVRQSLNIGPEIPLIAFMGQHGLHKGIGTLIAAMPSVWKRFPETRLIIAGGKTAFSPGFTRMSEFFDDEKKKKIVFFDNVDEETKSGILRECDIFATPSGFESFGITILEAWKRKKPVVACRIEATMNLVEEYKTGLLVDYENTGELAAALVELIADEGLRRKLGENGYKKLEAEYSWEKTGREYHNFYLQACQ